MKTKDIKIIQEQRKYLKKGFNNVNKKSFNDKCFISERKMKELFSELHFYIKKSLTEIFGKVGSYDKALDYGILNDLLSSHNVKVPSLGIVFSYFSHQGAPIAFYKSNEGKERQNLFYKGYIWSDKERYDKWYKKFNFISEIITKNVPVDFFSYHAVKHKKNKIKLLDIAYLKYYKNNNPDTINLPIFDDLHKSTDMFSKEFTDLIKTINEIKSKNELNQNEVEEFKIKLSKKINKAWNSLKDNKEINRYKDDIIAYFNQDDKIEKEDVFNMIVAYQFYEVPSNTLIYIPIIENCKDTLYSCLAFQLPSQDMSFTKDIEDELLVYLTELNNICSIEESIWNEAKTNYASYLFWKDKYDEIIPQFEILENFYLTISKSICVNKDIKILDTRSRIKDFDSFFNKMVVKANDGTKREVKEKYLKAIKEHTLEDVKFILANIKDLIGIRIITVYRDNIITFLKEFVYKFVLPDKKNSPLDKMNLSEIETNFVNLEDYYNNYRTGAEAVKKLNESENSLNEQLKNIVKNKNIINDVLISELEIYDKGKYHDYQTIQFNACLGVGRKNLYEFRALRYPEIWVEIQVRSILQQGWADFSHDLLYKSKIPLALLEEFKVDKETTLLQHSFKVAYSASAYTTNADISFTELKNEIQKKLKEYDL